MRINAIGAEPILPQTTLKQSKIKSVNRVAEVQGVPVLHISFQGNPSKKPYQIAAFATESNYLGGIYVAGGLGDVAEALPDAIGNHGESVAGKPVDVRTFFPYYSMDDSEGRIYVLTKEGVEKRKNLKKDEKLNLKTDFKLVDRNYKLQEGERFALITDIDGAKNVKKYHLLNDVQLEGTVERMKEKGMEMEKVPYRVFEVDTEGKRKDRIYLIHTDEHAKGKSSYGVYRRAAAQVHNGSMAYGGSTAYGGSGGSTAYGRSGGSTAYGGSGGSTAYGGASGAERRMHYFGTKADDMFYTEQLRAYQQLTMEGKMDTAAHGNFNPQNHMFHDRFCYSALTDITQKANKGDKNYQGLRFVEILHNPGATYQGKYGNPLDFFRIIATHDDLEKLKANEHYSKVNEIANKIEAGRATEEESTQLYKFFRPYFKKLMDSEGLFNMTMLAVRMTDENPQNSNLGNVSKNYGKETRNMDTIDIAKGLTEELSKIQDKTIDVVNGSKKANMATDKVGEFFGTGSLHAMFKTKYKPYAATDSPDKIYKAKLENKKNAINEIAAATKRLSSDRDAVAKVFFSTDKIDAIRKQAEKTEPNLPLTLGGLSEYKQGDILFTTWGRPDPQKGLPITLEAFEAMLKDESIPLETRKHCKLVMGAGGGNDAFSGTNEEWVAIKEAIERIGNIEAGGEKGVFKNNALYVNGLFPKRIANCADLGIFTSRFEPCGITPFECFASGTPVISTNTGGAPDFIKPNINGLLTKDPFMLNPEKVGLPAGTEGKALDDARKANIAKQIAEQMKVFLEPVKDKKWEAKQKEYIKNCLAEQIEWHNNNSYNGGKSALEIYLKEKFNIVDNNLPDTYASDMRGEFDNTAFKSSIKNKGRSKGRKTAMVVSILAVAAGTVYAAVKKGWFHVKDDNKPEEKKSLSQVA